MKRFLFLTLALLAFALPMSNTANAQAQTSQTQLTGTSIDTIAGGSSGTYYLIVKGNKAVVSFQYNVAKISGTLAGTIKLYGSIESTPTNYQLINTYTLTDASSIGGYTINYNSYAKYKVVVGPTGTNSASYDIWGLHR